MPLDSVLRQLVEEDRSTDLMADGCDDDLGMNVDCDYRFSKRYFDKNSHYHGKKCKLESSISTINSTLEDMDLDVGQVPEPESPETCDSS